jgi:hypothetical protein
MQLQQRVINAEQKLQEINYVAMRLNYLFAVLKSKEVFPQEFITQCSNEVMELLKIETKEEEETKTEEYFVIKWRGLIMLLLSLLL